ncbi:uncharacterized protein N7484_006492 [Penicillium longicatenatum]|uniref:uncharacterized protein n=1 Tax=Penicillium longicatenatum TaxID=1561947 RepID=UPI002548A62D|nr:uncharacterized protein N7484_006492 [Penicillium longicatenatum]KAJ5643985.1 hypothetical protein N7484_006492 [Penicillium longicatenatum]
MMPDPTSHANDEETASPSQRRFSAVEPLDRLQATLPAVPPQAAKLDIRSIPTTSAERCRASIIEASTDQDVGLSEKIAALEDNGKGLPQTYAEETVLYLAYGSNLAAKTFLGMRGIKPISKICVLVPDLRLTFDLPGVPYAEPCFAGTQFRDPDASEPESESEVELTDDEKLLTESEYLSEKASLPTKTRELRTSSNERRWHKPLVGVVYEVTLMDYAKIIATEGGGRGYRDVVVDCYPFAEDYKSTNPVPEHPSTQAFKTHTLLSPAADDARKRVYAGKGVEPATASGSCSTCSIFGDIQPHMRPDPEYAQPSARYLGLLITGSEEHDLPISYREYLSSIHSYHMTTSRQKIGRVIFLGMWGPPILFTLQLSKAFAGPDGRSPPWLVTAANLLFSGMWNSYDYIFKRVFGDGERTIDDTPSS